MIRKKCLGIAAALLAAPLAMLPAMSVARAQSASMTVPEIQECLCLQPRLQPLQDAWLQKQHDFDEHQAQLATVNQEVTAQRQKLDPNDIVGQQVLKDLLSQQQELRDVIATQYLPAVNQARDTYNAAVQRYNGVCTRPRYSADEAKARSSLSCPAQ